MKIYFRYFSITFLFIILIMHFSYGWLVKFTETSSHLWFFSDQKKSRSEYEILVLGDSQILSGISAKTIAEIEHIAVEKILYLVRPSEQPEGMLDLYLSHREHLPHLRKVYFNLSPISISQNNVTEAHKQLYYGFRSLKWHHISNQSLRKAYFPSVYDFLWKSIIEIFPYFGLNQNYSTIFSIVPSDSIFYEGGDHQTNHQMRAFSTFDLLLSRSKESEFLISHFQSHTEWSWKVYTLEKALTKDEKFPKGSSLAFAKQRKLSIQILNEWISILKEDGVDFTCFVLPFSPYLEKDMEYTGIKKIFEMEIGGIGLQNENLLNMVESSEQFKNPEYFVDFTHLNQNGRDVLHSILVQK